MLIILSLSEVHLSIIYLNAANILASSQATIILDGFN